MNFNFSSLFKANSSTFQLQECVELALLYESYRRQPISQILGASTVTILVLVLIWLSGSDKSLIFYLIPLHCSFLYNYFSYTKFLKAKPTAAEMKSWQGRYFHQCWVNGLAWNAISWQLIDGLSSSLQTLWVSYFIAVGFSSVIYLFANNWGSKLFLISLLFPSVVRFYVIDKDSGLISCVILASLCFMLFQANEMYKTFCALIQARHTEEEARNHAEVANTYKSQFLANVSHEIRTPMTAVLGMLQLLKTTPQSARQVDYTIKAEAAGKSLLTLINEVLDFSKIEAEKLVLEKRPFNLIALLDEVDSLLVVNITKPIKVQFLIDPSIPKVLIGDAMRLRQILLNLAGNAIKFTNYGKVTISVIAVGFNENGFLLKFMVEDTGIGISKNNSKRIFDEFTQADASTSRRFGGTGLGLAICKSLIKMMGGAIQLESEEGKGSVFYFSIRLQALSDMQTHIA
jgi:signal transduction histidine kinase